MISPLLVTSAMLPIVSIGGSSVGIGTNVTTTGNNNVIHVLNNNNLYFDADIIRYAFNHEGVYDYVILPKNPNLYNVEFTCGYALPDFSMNSISVITLDEFNYYLNSYAYAFTENENLYEYYAYNFGDLLKYAPNSNYVFWYAYYDDGYGDLYDSVFYLDNSFDNSQIVWQTSAVNSSSIMDGITAPLGIIDNLASEFLNGFTDLVWDDDNQELTSVGVFSFILLGISIVFSMIRLAMNLLGKNTGSR